MKSRDFDQGTPTCAYTLRQWRRSLYSSMATAILKYVVGGWVLGAGYVTHNLVPIALSVKYIMKVLSNKLFII